MKTATFALSVAVAILVAPWTAVADELSDCNGARDDDVRIKACSTLIAALPENWKFYLNRGIAYRYRANLKAIADFNEVIRQQPSYIEAYTLRGHTYMLLQQTDLAIADFSVVIEARKAEPPSVHPSMLEWRGDLYVLKGDFDRAVADYTWCLEIDPTNWSTYFGRAKLFEKTGNTDKAIADYRKADEHFNGHDEAKAALRRLGAMK